MIIGNGFFSDTEQEAVGEMRQRSGCAVARVPFPTIGNINYYVSERGDVYGMQSIQGKKLTRTKKCQRNKKGFFVRLSTAPHKETFFPLETVTYCTFTLHRWQPDVELDFIDGNCFNVHPSNLRPRQEVIPPEWAEHMEWRKGVYKAYFAHVSWSVNYVTGLDLEDCKDITQTSFIYLCTTGWSDSQSRTDIVGLWIKIARLRAIDYIRQRFVADSDFIERVGRTDRPYEVDLIGVLRGKRSQDDPRKYMEGETPREIAHETGRASCTVRSSISRSISFLQRYLRKEI